MVFIFETFCNGIFEMIFGILTVAIEDLDAFVLEEVVVD